jgi:hypothetical protein
VAGSGDVRFSSNGCLLAGTYTEAAAPIAAALVLTGSGRINRDSDVRLLRTGVTKAVAGALTAAHVSSLRYDKRGIGASEGDYHRAGMADVLADARAALGWLAARAPGLPLLVVGHSEGAIHAAEMGTDPDVSGVVLLSMPAQTGEQVLAWQTAMLASRLPRSARIILWLGRTDIVRIQRKRVAQVKAAPTDMKRIHGARVNARWLRDFMACDPSQALTQIAVPVLAITGGHDLQVDPGDVDVMSHLVTGPFEGHVVGDLSHLLRPDPGSVGPRGYRRAVRQPVSPEVLNLITGWVTSRWGPAPARGGSAPGRRGL